MQSNISRDSSGGSNGTNSPVASINNGPDENTSFQGRILYVKRHRVIVCITCGIGIVPNAGVRRHLKDHHKDWPLKDRKEIIHFALQQQLASPQELVPPGPSEMQIPGLAIHDGWRCQRCPYMCASKASMAKHCQLLHRWVKARGIEWDPVTLQTFFGGPQRHFFQVARLPLATPQERQLPIDVNTAVATLIQQGEQQDREEADQAFGVISNNQLAVDNTPWMRRTRWATKFSGRNILAIAAYSNKPGLDEGSLKLVWDSVLRVFQRCKASVTSWCKDEDDGNLVLGWLSSQKQDRFNPEPFSVYYEESTHTRYASYMARAVCYFMRLLHAEDNHGHILRREEREQLQQVWDVIELDAVNEAALDKRIFTLAVLLWMHQARADSKSAIVHFTAILGIDGTRGCYRQPSEHGQVLAALLYCARLLLFEHALPAATRSEIQDSYAVFLEVHHQWLVDGRPTPFHYIDNLLAYALGAGREVGGKPRVQWSADRQTMVYQGQRLLIQDLRTFINQLCAEAEEVLYRDLMFLPGPSEITSFNIQELADNMNDSTVGRSFVSDTRNNLGTGREKMLTRLMALPEKRELLVQGASGLQAKGKQWQQYLAQLEHFQALLFPLMHICSGVPAQGPEILTIRHINVAQNMRNIFILDGQVMWVTAYHKSQALSGHHKTIPRFLPTYIGQLLIAYLANVLPFLTLVDRNYIPQSLRSFLWVSKKGLWDTTKATKHLAEETATRLGIRVTIQDYRHIAKAIDREHVRGLVGDDDNEADNIHDLAAAHSSHTANNVYGIDASLLHSLNAQSINAFRTVTDRWHQFLHMNSRQISKYQGKRQHSLSEAGPLPPSAKRALPKVERNTSGKLLTALQKLMGPGSNFWSVEQKDATIELVRGTSPLVVILPTGGGKSLIFQLPASLPNAQTTIVVVPFRALAKDLLRRCRILGLGCSHWTSDHQQAAQITIVSADSAISETFLTFTSELQTQGRLDRIVIDECHIPLISGSYRQRLTNLDRLRAIPCQLVLLTGTLPPSLEGALADTFLLGPTEDGLQYIRACTNRPNVQYCVLVLSESEVERVACELVQHTNKASSTTGQAILFCRSRPTCERMATVLGCRPYYSTYEEKDESLAAWMDGQEKTIVATSALGTGIDTAYVKTVVHLGRPHGIIDFVQEVGRAGRKGEHVRSTIVVGRREMEAMQSEKYVNADLNQRGLCLFITCQCCWRTALSEFMDGTGVNCSQAKGQKCDICSKMVNRGADEADAEEEVEVEALGASLLDMRANWATRQQERYANGARLWQGRVQGRGRERQRIEQALSQIGGECAACWVHKVSQGAHDINSCPTLAATVGVEYRVLRRQIKYVANTCCYRCSLPADWCSTYTGRQRCVDVDIVVPVVFAGWGLPQVRKLVKQEVGEESVSGLVKWMGMRAVVAGDKGTNAVRAVGIILEAIEQD